MTYKCPFCASEVEIESFLLHINRNHKYEKCQLYYCSYCEGIFRNVYNYRKHLINIHPLPAKNSHLSNDRMQISAQSCIKCPIISSDDKNSEIFSLSSQLSSESEGRSLDTVDSSSKLAQPHSADISVANTIPIPEHILETKNARLLQAIGTNNTLIHVSTESKVETISSYSKRRVDSALLGNKTIIHKHFGNVPSTTSLTPFHSVRPLEQQNARAKSSSVTISDLIKFNRQMYIHIGNFTASLYGDKTVSRKHADRVINQVSSLFNTISQEISQKNKCSELCHSNIDSMFQSTNSVFNTFSTEYKTKKFLRQEGYYIPPYTKTLTCVLSSKRVKRIRSLLPIKIKIAVIPIKEVLKKFLELPNVFDSIHDFVQVSRNSTDDQITSPLQGEIWRSVEKKFKGKIVLPLVMSADDLEINNPLGSHRGVHQLGCIYINLPCLPEEFRGSLENIFLVQLHNSRDYKKVGNARIFTEIKKQLHELESNGINITVDGQNKQVFFTLLAVTGDNLGLQEFLGFKSGFNSEYSCRFCLSLKDVRKRQTKVNSRNLRTKKNYNKHSKKAERGISEKCVFNALKYFHVIENMIVDEHHDYLEGTLRKTIPKILYKLIYFHKYFTLTALNWSIKHFDYGPGHGLNPPPPITEKALKKGYLVNSASEMKTLLRYLSMYVGHLIPEECQEWKLYILTRKIYRIVNSNTCSKATIDEYSSLIHQHHELFIKLFDENLSPKFHLQLHYGQVMKRLGPVKFFSAMRPEGNHRVIKDCANSTTSRVNPALTCAIKNQMNLGFRFLKNEGFTPHLSWTQSKDVLIDIAQIDVLANTIPSSFLANSLNASAISIYGTSYEVNMCLMLQYGVFGQIEKILIDKKGTKDCVIFIWKKMKTTCYSDHLQAFQVEQTEEWGHINHKDLFSYKPLVVHSLEYKKYLLHL